MLHQILDRAPQRLARPSFGKATADETAEGGDGPDIGADVLVHDFEHVGEVGGLSFGGGTASNESEGDVACGVKAGTHEL